MSLTIYTRRVPARGVRGSHRVWAAWVPGLGFSAEGHSEAEAVGELVALLADHEYLLGPPASAADLADLVESERDELVEAEGGVA